ncbi:MAG: succinyl-diaminopimelate desuccinylase [Parvularculaceae bacterium]|nr:succinyl-diaminopimelate desuccinylase [Parvularculaceae bacterium]
MPSLIDPIELTRALVRRPSVTPADEGALDVLEAALRGIGFQTERLRFEETGTPPVDNLYARLGAGGRHFCFAGHTDVVPTGPLDAWTHPPFAAAVEDGFVWGRGAADMKGAIAAFVAAAERASRSGAADGHSISLLITGDEEGVAINGTRKVLKALAARGVTIDRCLVGEPSSVARLGDVIKVGRRGSMNCRLAVQGRQGHVAYPDRAANPVHALAAMIGALAEPLDDGFEAFEASRLQATDLEVGNPAHNVIPATARARFNVRFNPNWTGASLEGHLRERLDREAARFAVAYGLDAVVSGEAFLTRDDAFLALLDAAVAAHCGSAPEHSTTGGTSDARFIKDYAPVAELGLVNATIHQANERAAVADILRLADIYAEILRRSFA